MSVNAERSKAQMTDEQKIKRLLDHRMQSVATLNWALELRSQWTEAPSIAVYIDGKLMIEGNLNAVTNPIIGKRQAAPVFRELMKAATLSC